MNRANAKARRVLGVLAVLITLLACRATLAQVTNYVVVNPIDVCLAATNNGTTTKTCTPFGMRCTTNSDGSANCGTAFNDPVAATSSPQAIATTPIGFVDASINPATNAASNINLTRAIWLQTGVDVVFLPIQEFDSPITCATGSPNCNMIPTGWSSLITKGWPATDYRTLHVVGLTDCTGAARLVSPDLAAFTNYTLPCGSPTTTTALCCAAKAPLYGDSRVINMFFVNNILNISSTPAADLGLAWINGNGIAINGNSLTGTFNPNAPDFDILAHEIGHALNLDHTTLGAGTACSGKKYPFGANADNGCNVMDAGATNGIPFRTVPTSSGCLPNSTTYSGGALFDLDTSLCGTSKTEVPLAPQADQLLLGTSTSTQQGMALASAFMVPVAQVPASATAGGGTHATATTTSSTIPTEAATVSSTSSTCPSPNSPLSFTVNFPPFKTAGGRSPNEFIVSLVLALPQGFAFGPNPFCQTGSSPMVVGTEQLNGNNGNGNVHCLKPIAGAPTIQCLEIDFLVQEPSPGNFVGSFAPGTNLTFTSDIVAKGSGMPATLADLQCSTAAPDQCLDLTYVFNDLFATTSFFGFFNSASSLNANSQEPDVTVASTIVNPSTFPNLPADYPPFQGFGSLDTNGRACTLLGKNNTCPAGSLPAGD